ncbi:MAG TPA: ABC transporter permease subunit, partial [Kofleriaceae bacterium]|nr:ABC transporter permease subunit [Kofleriaceae bacterium]
MIGLAFANVMTGSVLVENVFSWPGIGQYAYHAASTLDLPAIMGVSLFVAVVYIVVNFLVDVLYDYDNRTIFGDYMNASTPNDWLRLPDQSLWSDKFNGLE